MKVKPVALALCLAGLAALAWLVTRPDAAQQSAPAIATPAAKIAVAVPLSATPEGTGANPVPQPTSVALASPPVASNKVSFEYLYAGSVQMAIQPKSKVSPLGAFSYPQGAMAALNIGDSIVMPPIGPVRHELKVAKKVTNSDGSVTLETTVNNAGPSNYAIITEAKNATFVTLRAPGAVYEMEGIGGTGYVYSALDIKRAKIDYSISDAIPHKGTMSH